MTRFVGGPYDGQDLPVDPSLTRSIRLPNAHELDSFLQQWEADPGATGKHDWPHVYSADTDVVPPLYRYVDGKQVTFRPGVSLGATTAPAPRAK